MIFLPIVERELRVAARKPGTHRLRLCFALGSVLLWLVLALTMQDASSSPLLGRRLFLTISVLGLIYCVVAGIFLTADCLSEEKREGTLGLLFLTDLKGYDIVLGKLAATSVHALCSLLTILPILALSLLLGGVTAAQFWLVALALLVTLLFSLATAMFVSAVSRDSRQAMGGVLFILALVTVVLPTIRQVLVFTFHVHSVACLLWPNPFHLYNVASFGPGYSTHEFWFCLGTLLSLSVAALVAASLILPHVWQERKKALSVDRREAKMRLLRFGKPALRRVLRAKWISSNPFYWLASRDRLPRMIGWVLFGSMMALWLCLFAGLFIAPPPANFEAFGGILAITFALNLIFKYLVAMEASRRLNEDRHSGALELLLVTPLSERQILAGQKRALLQHFRVPLAVLLFAKGALLWVLFGPNPMKLHGIGSYGIMFAGSMLMLLFDFQALGWMGMWQGLRSKSHQRAILATLALIILPLWALLLFIGMVILPGKGTDTSDLFLTIWFIVCGIYDLLAARRAKSNLLNDFRRSAANLNADVQPATAPAPSPSLEPIGA